MLLEIINKLYWFITAFSNDFSFSTINPLHIRSMHLANTNNYPHKIFKNSVSQKINSHKSSTSSDLCSLINKETK